MTDEVELFETQIAENLMTIGWIHTHPQFVSIHLSVLNTYHFDAGPLLVISGLAQSVRLPMSATGSSRHCLLTYRWLSWVPSLPRQEL